MNQENPYQPPTAEVADVSSSDESELATRGARLAAAIVDGVLVLFVVVPAMIASGYWQTAMSGQQPTLTTQLSFGLLGIVVYVVFHGYLLHNYGQTIGKRFLRTRIVFVEDNRIVPLWRILLLRQLPIAAASLLPVVGRVVGLADSLFIFGASKRCLHDLIAGTKVVNASAPWKAQDKSVDG